MVPCHAKNSTRTYVSFATFRTSLQQACANSKMLEPMWLGKAERHQPYSIDNDEYPNYSDKLKHMIRMCLKHDVRQRALRTSLRVCAQEMHQMQRKGRMVRCTKSTSTRTTCRRTSCRHRKEHEWAQDLHLNLKSDRYILFGTDAT